jgi:hypothetical protein
MRCIIPLLISGFLLSACHSLNHQTLGSSTAPIAITDMSSQGDANKGVVEVQITVANRLSQDLKAIRVVLVLRDAQGSRLKIADQTIEILGPIHKGQSLGPLEKVIPVANDGTVCAEVTRIEAMTLDYAMISANGKDASAAVTNAQNCLRQS